MNQERMDKMEAQDMKEPERAPAPGTLEGQDEQLPVGEEEQTATVAQLAADLEEARRLSDEYLNLAQRVQADFDNYRRRNNAARAEAFDEGAIALAKTLLPVIDNLERALEASADTADTAMREGVQLVYRQLKDAFEKRGILPINRLGEKFDPTQEDAVMTASSEEGEPGTVCQVFQKGYRMDKCVLRHAMVKVVAE